MKQKNEIIKTVKKIKKDSQSLRNLKKLISKHWDKDVRAISLKRHKIKVTKDVIKYLNNNPYFHIPKTGEMTDLETSKKKPIYSNELVFNR